MSDAEHRRDLKSARQTDLTDLTGGIALSPREYEFLGKAFVGDVIATTPDNFEGEGRHRKLRPLVTVRLTAGVEPTPGVRLGTPDRRGQEAEVVEVKDGLVTLKITMGMGRGKTPAPGAVPEVGEHARYFQVTESSPEEPEPVEDDTEPQVKVVTMNQLVAFNMAYWRRYHGGTQEDLGKRIAQYNRGEPWSKANVSAAERTWDGTRLRRFDADDILMLARVLDVPISGLFLPPEDAGAKVQYLVGDPALPVDDETHLEMGEFINYLINIAEDDDCGCGTVARYGRRFEALVDFYLGQGTYSGWMKDRDGHNQPDYQAQADRVRGQIRELRGLLGDLERIQDTLSQRSSEDVQANLQSMLENGPIDPIKKLSDELKDRILDLYKSGESIRTIAVTVGHPKSQVFRVLHRAGAYVSGRAHTEHMRALAAKAAARYESGEDIELIARDLNHSTPHLYRSLLSAETQMRAADTKAFLLEEWDEAGDGTDGWDHL